MTVTADSKRRVLLRNVKPGECFDVQVAGEGRFVLTRLEPVEKQKAKVKIRKVQGYSVGTLDRPINEEAIREALNEFP